MIRSAAAFLLLGASVNGQEIYDLLLRNGQVIDPANHRKGRFDVAVIGNKIVRVAPNLPAAHARVLIDASQYYVTPGLIDTKVRFSVTDPEKGIRPDPRCLSNGVTTAVDRGVSDDLASFKKLVVDRAKVRVLTLPAIARDALSDTISSGIDSSRNTLPLAGMMNSMSMILNRGMSIEQVVERATANPARAIGRSDLGTLSEGAVADVALLEMLHGKFGFLGSNHEDSSHEGSNHEILAGDRKLRCVLTVRNGAILWDSEGLAATDSIKAGPYSNYK